MREYLKTNDVCSGRYGEGNETMDTIKDYWVKKWKYWFSLDEYEAIADEIYLGELSD